MKILAIETSCDDTCAAVMEDDRVLASVVSSQVDLHKKWGGVVPNLAKRAHESRIKAVIATALIRSKIPNYKSTLNPSFEERRDMSLIIEGLMKLIDVIAVTTGPGLAPALGVGVETAKELAKKYKKRLVEVNHIEGHLLSNWIKNKNGKPERKMEFPALSLTVSGGHTKIILVNQNNQFQISNLKFKKGKNKNFEKFDYQIIGETLDDAAGEALDKAAKLLGLGYPGGPVIERVAGLRRGYGSVNRETNLINLPKPLADKKILDFSFSGLKTSFYYQIKDWPAEKINKHLGNLAASFQEAVLEHLIRKFKLAIEKYRPKMLLASGGVMANRALRKKLRALAKETGLKIYLPAKKEWNTDNAAMIGVAGYFKAMRGEYVEDIEKLDRKPRWEIGD